MAQAERLNQHASGPDGNHNETYHGMNRSLNGKDVMSSENALVEAWKKASADFVTYKAGTVEFPNLPPYDYRKGERLIIKEQQVMDSCEYPWSQATVNKAFEELQVSDETRIRVLELGFGLGITANRVIDRLKARGQNGLGSYHVVELNRDVFKRAGQWEDKWLKRFKDTEKETGSKPDITIEVEFGEAGEVVQRLLEEGAQYEIIISDTFPLKPEDKGINDLKHASILKKLLALGGVFAFYPYVPGYESESEKGLVGKMLPLHIQDELLSQHFKNRAYDEAEINPPPDYTYLFRENGPIRVLPVIVCKDPKP